MKKISVLYVIMLLTILLLIFPTTVKADKAGLNKTSFTMYPGQEIKLKINNYEGTVIWKSKDKFVATVSKGKVKAVNEGNTDIVATVAKTNICYTCTITVKNRLSSDVKSINCGLDDYATIKISCTNLNSNESLMFSLSNSKIASMDQEVGQDCINVYITPKKSGSVTLTVCTANYNKKLKLYEPNDNDKVSVKIKVGISDKDEWISSSDLLDIYRIDAFEEYDSIIFMKQKEGSITGSSDIIYSLEYEQEYKENIIYGCQLRYKLVNNSFMYNISDLKKLNII